MKNHGRGDTGRVLVRPGPRREPARPFHGGPRSDWYAAVVLPAPLSRLVSSYVRTLRPATLSAALGGFALALVVGAHVARAGSERTRWLAIALVLAVLVAAGLRFWFQRRWSSSPSRAIRSILMSTQPDVGRRVLRALLLSERGPEQARGESTDLARLHYERMLSRASVAAVTNAATERARRFGRFALVTASGAGLLLVVAPQRLLEGLDLVLAQDGVAPVPMEWLEDPAVEATPPPYLRMPRVSLGLDAADVMPEGTEIVFRGVPAHAGRTLVLSDGKREEPFADDGSGSVVARWELTEPARLRVAARFGDVLIHDPRTIDVFALPDRAPMVELAGAPADIALESMERLELHWAAKDDHSIVEVELVLRSAGKEERRPLERYPGDKKEASGGYVLGPDDAFLQRLFLPATVRIEARDNDPREGSKWGHSQAFTLRPPIVGAAHVARYVALASIRERLVDLLVLLRTGKTESATERKELGQRALAELAALEAHAAQVLGATYTGLGVPRGWANFARAQLEALRKIRTTTEAGLEKGVAAIEQSTLGIDQALQSLAYREAQAVSKQLASVADEAAQSARGAQGEKGKEDAVARLDVAIAVLGDGAAQLSQLGELGYDLGSVARADLDRVARSTQHRDYFHAELAALHMAERLRRPNPSFGSKGGGGGGGGVEAGPGHGGGGGSDAQGETSEAESEFDRMARELERLSQEHQEGIEQTNKALREAERQLRADDAEAKRRADALRRAVMRLPEPGEQPGTGRASAALAREHTGAMAHELERSNFENAIDSGRRAQSAAEEALRRGNLGTALERELQQTLEQLKEQIAWAEEQLDRKQRLSEEAAREALEQVAQLEQELAERARRLSGDEDASELLPKDAAERLERAGQLMREAAEKLSGAKGSEGLELQRDAQRLLEQAKPGRTDDEKDARPNENERGDGHKPAMGGDVPDPDEGGAAEDFRRRVLDGLQKKSGGRLAPAIQRYAEGLLR